MKKTIIGLAIAGVLLAACNSNSKKTSEENKTTLDTTQVNDPGANVTSTTGNENVKASIKEIVNAYLQLKNALTRDNTKDAATAGTGLETAFKTVDKTAMTAEQKKAFEDVVDDAREHAEHIGSNSGNIAHQREHFEMLSNDMYDLVKAFGSEQTLYKDFCPMYNNKKGAFWLSETKEITNPYYGNEMLKCGQVKEEIKSKE